MKAIKTTLSVLTLILFAGCATVTDANVDINEEPATLSSERIDNTWDSTTRDTMGEIIIRPDMGE